MKQKMKVFVQGEVVIKQIEKLPQELPEKSKDNVVAYGETGGAHVLQGDRFTLYGHHSAAVKYLEVDQEVELTHGHGNTSGHEVMKITPGTYSIEPQVEIDVVNNKLRAVMD